MSDRSVVVVGAGAAGLSAALRLHHVGCDVRVYEASPVVGGRCRTVEIDGFRFDIAAGALPATYKQTIEMIADLGLSGELERRGAVIGTLHDGEIQRIDRRRPWSILGARHLTGGDKLSLWKFGRELARMYRSLNYSDLSTAGRFDTESVSQWARRNFDERVLENFVAPLTRALFLVEPERTSVVDLFSAAKSLLVASSLITHPDGAGFFLDAAARRLDVTCNTIVTEVKETGDGVVVRTAGGETHAAACVLALPALPTLAVYPDLGAAQRTYLQELEYSATIVVNLGVARAPDESSSMVLIPRTIEPDMPVVALGHNLGPSRAPAGKGTLAAYWMDDWSRAHWADSDDAIVEQTARTINRLLPGWADNVEASVVSRWDPAMVATRPGTYQRLATFMQHLDPTARIQLAGDYFSQTSVNASVVAGRDAADRILTHLRP